MRLHRRLILRIFVALAAVAALPAYSDYVVNQIDYRDPATGQVALFTTLQANNNNGQVVGTASMVDATGGVGQFSFTYDPSTGAFSPMPLPPGYDGVTGTVLAWSINDQGAVTGTASQAGLGDQGFVWANGTYSMFSVPGWAATQGRTISNPTPAHPQGLVDGFANNSSDGLLDGWTAFVYDPATHASVTIPVPNSYVTIAQGLNIAGQIVGSAVYQFGSGLPRANGAWGFLFTPTTGSDPTLGGTLDYFRINGMPTRPRGINDHGVMAAGVRDNAAAVHRTYVGTSAGFQEIVMPVAVGSNCATALLDGGSFPQGLNNAGQVTGTFVDASCQSHGFIATPASLPTGTTSNGAYTFNVDVVPDTPVFIDPPVAIGYDYAVGAGDPRFATVRLPLGIGDNRFVIVVGHDAYPVNAGQRFDFRTHGFPQGVGAFSVACIDEGATLDPANARAFPTELTFAGAGKFTGSQRPVTRNVPSAAAAVLAGRDLCPRRAH